jgi:hypothetical protein
MQLLYVDSVKCKGIVVDKNVNAITFWNMNRLRERQKLEISKGGFGIGKLKKLSKVVDYGMEEEEPERGLSLSVR